MLISRSERFILNEVVRYIVGQSRTTINFREVMDQGKILLVKLPGKYEDTTELLGSMIIAEVLTAALSRGDIPQNKRRQFNIYADEFQKFASSDFSKLLTECRKYGQAVTIAHQARDFIDLKNKAAALQAANIAVFRVIPKDAHELAGSFDCSPIQGEPRKEFKRTPVGDLLEDIVSGRRHLEKIVNDFCLKFADIVRDAHLSPREGVKDTIETRSGPRGQTVISRQGRYEGNEVHVSVMRKTLAMMNNFFYEVMLEKDPQGASKIVPIDILWSISRWFQLPFRKGYQDYVKFLSPINLSYFTHEPDETMLNAYVALWRCLDADLEQVFTMYEQEARKQLTEYFKAALAYYFSYIYQEIEITDYENKLEFKYPPYDAKYPQKFQMLSEKETDLGFEHIYIPVEQLEYVQVKHQYYTVWQLKPGTLEKLPVDQYIAAEVDQIVTTKKPSFDAFVREFRQIIQALAEQPILGSSGVEEIVTNEIPSHEVANRIANELSHLEKHTARVRIHGVSDKLEEYLIETEKPASGINGTQLEERKQRILKNMLVKGIYRSKQTIEEEIRNRHAKLRTTSQKPV